MLIHRTSNFEVCHREFKQLFKTPYRLGDNDEVCDAVVKSVTSYAAGIIIHELTRAREKRIAMLKQTASVQCLRPCFCPADIHISLILFINNMFILSVAMEIWILRRC